MRTLYTVLVAALAATAPALASSIDLGEAVVVAPADLTGPEEKAVQMLVEEVEKRSTVRCNPSGSMPNCAARPDRLESFLKKPGYCLSARLSEVADCWRIHPTGYAFLKPRVIIS